MKLDGVIYTTKKYTWFDRALVEIYRFNSLVKGIKMATYKVVEIPFPTDFKTKQTGVAVRPDFTWLQKKYKQDGQVLCLHISKAEHDLMGLRHPDGGNLGGTYNRNLGDSSIEFLVVADTFAKFVRLFIHEQSHGLSHWSGVTDRTHEMNDNLEAYYKTIDFTKQILLTKQKNALERLVEALKASLVKKKPRGLKHPVEQYRELISQEYGVRNEKFYPQTKHHIGTDYACLVGTPVRAPWDGDVTVSGTSPALGNFCHYKYTFEGVTYMARFLHLSAIPVVAKYKRGEVIELSGKTGKVSGPHLHIDLFYNEVRLDILTEKNFRNLTLNPQKHYAIT